MGLTLNKATLSEMEIELPTIEEQREIASILDQLDAIIEKRHDELNMIEQLVKSRFIELFGDPGDHGREDYDEVGAMKDYAIENGVPSENVFMDHAGFSTYETVYRAKEIFEADKVIIVTQEYHLYRALYIAEQLGVDAYGVSSDLNTYAGQSMRDAREVLARCKDWLMCIFKPEPTYLGEAIPVSGNGDVTND